MVAVLEKKKAGGLAGVTAGDSAICLCGSEDESLLYRGYRIEDLAAHATFEEVCWLLLRGNLPTKQELEGYCKKLKALRDLPRPLKEVLERIPGDADRMDVLRTGCSFLGTVEQERHGDHFAAADRLIATCGSMLLYWQLFQEKGKRIDLNTQEDSLAGHILHLIHGAPAPAEHKKCLDVALILYAEHEFNASTFTVRTIASTLSDFYSAMCGGIGALKGALHGGANQAAMHLIESFGTPQDAEKGIKRMLAEKQLIMGFGHRVYTTKDPRSHIIKEWARKVAKDAGDRRLFPIAEKIESVMGQEKHIIPNLDFYSSLAFHFCSIPTPLFTPLFACARVSGWSAHFLEQRAHNKLIRPLSNYIGPMAQAWRPLDKR